MLKKMLLSTLLFKFDIHIGAVLIDIKNNEEESADGNSSDSLNEEQIELMKSNVFPESCTQIPQGVHSFCFSIHPSNDTIYCYTAFLSIPNSNSERKFDQYSYVIATRLPFYPLFLRLLDSINLIIDFISPQEIFTLLSEFATKWGKHLSLITFSKPFCPKSDNLFDNSFSSGSSSTNSSSDTSNSDSSDSSNNFVNANNITESNLYRILNSESPNRSNIIKKEEQNTNYLSNYSEIKEKSIELEIIQLDQNSSPDKTNTNSYSNSNKDISMMTNLNLRLCVSTRFELPLFNGVAPINPHPKFTHLLSTQSKVYCANPYFIGFDLISDIEDDFEGALSLWESCITDQPIVVIASTPRKATNASFAVASLSYPEEPPSSIIPYMSITDKRFKELSGKPKGIIGFSNPIVENLFIQRSKIVRVGFGKKSNKANISTSTMKRNSSANIHFNMSNNNNININQNNESSLNRNNSLPSTTKSKDESYASYTNSPLPPSKTQKMVKSPTMQMSLPKQIKLNPIQRSHSIQNQMNFKELNSAQIRYQLYQNTNRLRKAISEAIDTQISGDILNVLLNNFNLSIIDNRLTANAVLYSSPCIEFVSFLIKSRLFKRICKERLSTASAVSKISDLDTDNLSPEIAKKIFNSIFHVVQEQNIGKELEKTIKKKLRKIVPLFQHKQQKENTEMINHPNEDQLKNCNNEIQSS